jgi:hypothetical protein
MNTLNHSGIGSSINGNNILNKFSNIQMQTHLNNKGQKVSPQSRAFQSVNNFFNPRTAGGNKVQGRERISTHHFQVNKND